MELKISETIKNQRQLKGISQEVLANAFGVSVQAVSKWETGASLPDVLMIPRIAAYFGISVDQLFYGVKEDNGCMVNIPNLRDDGILRIVQFFGSRCLKAEEWREDQCINIDAEQLPEQVVMMVGGAANIDGDVNGNVEARGSVNCGSVEGYVEAQSAVNCDDVGGYVEAQGGVNCGDIGGYLEAQGGVNCGDVGGYLEAQGGVNCGDVNGYVEAKNSVNCGDINGYLETTGEVTCGDIAGSVETNGDIKCETISGADHVNCNNLYCEESVNCNSIVTKGGIYKEW